MFARIGEDPSKFEAVQDNAQPESDRKTLIFLVLFVTLRLLPVLSKSVLAPSICSMLFLYHLTVEPGRPADVVHTTGSVVFSITDMTVSAAGSM